MTANYVANLSRRHFVRFSVRAPVDRAAAERRQFGLRGGRDFGRRICRGESLGGAGADAAGGGVSGQAVAGRFDGRLVDRGAEKTTSYRK